MNRLPKVILTLACIFAIHSVSPAEQLPTAELGDAMRENHALIHELRASNDRIAALEKSTRRSKRNTAKASNPDTQKSKPSDIAPIRLNEGLTAGTQWGGLLDVSFPDGSVFRHTVAAKIEKESDEGFQIRLTFDAIEWVFVCVPDKNGFKINTAELVQADGHYKSKAGIIPIETSDIMIAKINGSYLLRINLTRPFENGFAVASYTLTRSY